MSFDTKRVCVCVVFFLCVSSASAVIYHLNESEFARMPPLYGLDEYGACLVPLTGIYCVVRLDLVGNDANPVLKLIHEYSENIEKHYNHTYLQRGVCVTSTCSNHIKNNSIGTEGGLASVLEECLNESIYSEYGVQSKLTQIYYCERKGQLMDIDLGDWVVLGVYATILVLNCIGTLYDVIISRTGRAKKGSKYLLYFSVIQNWRRLISEETEEVRAKRLMGLHGARVFTLFLMFTAHVMFINAQTFSENNHDFEELYDNAYYQLIFNGLVVVQVFFVISGFLLVYNMETYAEKNDVGWMLAPKIWLMRWWRLSPAYALVLAFMATWLRHIGSGPLWRMFVADSVVADCRQYWWAHLLYINNYIADGRFCAIHTWHLATDTQLFCMGLLVYMLTRHGGRCVAMALLVALGVVLPAVHVWWWDLDALVIMKPEFYRTMLNDTFHYLHVYGHNNIVSYAIGMSIGYLVYRMQKKQVDLTNNKVCIIMVWLIIPGITALFYSGSIFYAEGARLPLAVRMTYAALQRLLIGLAVGFGVIGLSLKFNTYMRYAFEARVWVVPSRLSYSVYLLHLLLIHTYVGMQTQMVHVSTFNMTIFHFGVMLLTFMVSIPFTLMVEAPLMRLMKTSEPPKHVKQKEVFKPHSIMSQL